MVRLTLMAQRYIYGGTFLQLPYRAIYMNFTDMHLGGLVLRLRGRRWTPEEK